MIKIFVRDTTVDFRSRSGKWFNYIKARKVWLDKVKSLTNYVPFSHGWYGEVR